MKNKCRPLILILILILSQFAFSSKVSAELTCPFGRVNDPAPGQCALFIDENNNDICDRSETGTLAQGDREEIKSTQLGQQKNLEAGLINFWALFLPAGLYFLHWFLVNHTGLNKTKGFFSPSGLKYFWNIILLLLFIPGGIFGLLIGLGLKTPFLVYWHYQGGAAFIVLVLIHAFNHLSYYFQGWKVLKDN